MAAPSAIGRFAAVWGIGGVVLFLGQALARLAPIAAEGLAMLEGPLAWTAVVVWVLAMAWGEGWRGFHLRFSPRVVARAAAVMRDPRPLRVVLAPAFCMSLFGASRRGLVVAWALLV